MKIAIDASSLDLPQPNGVKNYVLNLIANLALIDRKNEYYVFCRNYNLKTGKNFRHIKLPHWLILKKQLAIPYLIKKHSIDIVHFPEPYGTVAGIKAVRVTTVQDVSLNKIYGNKFTERMIVAINKFQRIFNLKNSQRIITSTKSIRNELFKKYRFAKNRTDTIYFAANKIFKKKRNIKYRFKYFLAISDFSGRKNIYRTITAFEQIAEQIKDHKLVVVVSTEKTAGIIKKHLKNKKIKNVKLVVNPSDTGLAQLYSGATAFIFPSLYEGFGLPVIEAMSCECPVVTSNLGAMKEVSAGAAYLVNPNSVRQIAQGMVVFATKKSFRKKYKILGYNRSKKLSWKITAQKTLKVYENAFKEKN